MFAFALVLAVSPGSPPADAERLLAEVDARIAAAKALRVEFEIRRTDKPDELPLKGSLVLGAGNRLRYEMTGWMTASVVSDGKRLVTVVVSPAERKSRPMPEWFGDTLRAWLGRGGTFVSTAKALEYADNPEVSRPGTEEGPRVSNARLMSDEKVGGMTATVIDYDLSWERLPTAGNTARVRVWIDPATKLPLKRTMTFPVGAKGESFTAVHTKFEIDPKVGDTLFRLPK